MCSERRSPQEVWRWLGKNSLPSTGIPYVIVNGVIVVKNSGIVMDVYPGRPIRNAPRK